jgi:hypothetical protein
VLGLLLAVVLLLVRMWLDHVGALVTHAVVGEARVWYNGGNAYLGTGLFLPSHSCLLQAPLWVSRWVVNRCVDARITLGRQFERFPEPALFSCGYMDQLPPAKIYILDDSAGCNRFQ